DDAIIMLHDDGLAVHSQEDGEKLYEVDGYFFDVVADGETFYVMEKSDETLMDLKITSYNILKFDEQNEDGEKIITAPPVTETYESDDTHLDIQDDVLFLKGPFSLLAYDKSSADFLWGTSVDGAIDRDHVDGDYSYDFRTD